MRRNLLSSQPVAFNLFGYLKHRPRALVAWLASLGIEAEEAEVRIEWAPPRAEHVDGASLSDEGVHVLDPFTGTGTFVTRLIQSGFIKPDDLDRKFTEELHA